MILQGFGSFQTKSVPTREHRNPKTGGKVIVSAHTKLVFKASKA